MELGRPESWMEFAACRQVDSELWFPEVGGSGFEAKRICQACPVRARCLAYALEHQERGIWGGTSEKQRQALRAEKGVA